MVHPLEPDEHALRALLSAATERVFDHLRALPEQPAMLDEGGAALARSLAAPMPEDARPTSEALDELFDKALSITFNTASPGYLAYIPGGGIFPSAVADFIADAINRYVGVWMAAPGLAQLELNVLRFFCDELGLPAGSGGFLTTGGSLANLSALITARTIKLGERFDDGCLFCTEQAHHSVQKSARLAGFREDQVISVATDDARRMRVDALELAIERARASGMRPALVVASAGTTNTGAIDPLEAIIDVAAREDLWCHVDAAYGGFFTLTSRGKAKLKGIERADSVTLDPHKGMFLPLGTGCLLVKDLDNLRRAHALWADYLPERPPASDLVDFSEISPELSRDFRGLRVWLPLQIFGARAFRATLDEKLDLAQTVAREIAARDALELVAPPELTVLGFWHKGGEEKTRALLDGINRRRRVFLTPTKENGRTLIRVAVLHFRTHQSQIDQLLEDLDAALEELGG